MGVAAGGGGGGGGVPLQVVLLNAMNINDHNLGSLGSILLLSETLGVTLIWLIVTTNQASHI